MLGGKSPLTPPKKNISITGIPQSFFLRVIVVSTLGRMVTIIFSQAVGCYADNQGTPPVR
jgi:hypothetical protein